MWGRLLCSTLHKSNVFIVFLTFLSLQSASFSASHIYLRSFKCISIGLFIRFHYFQLGAFKCKVKKGTVGWLKLHSFIFLKHWIKYIVRWGRTFKRKLQGAHVLHFWGSHFVFKFEHFQLNNTGYQGTTSVSELQVKITAAHHQWSITTHCATTLIKTNGKQRMNILFTS